MDGPADHLKFAIFVLITLSITCAMTYFCTRWLTESVGQWALARGFIKQATGAPTGATIPRLGGPGFILGFMLVSALYIVPMSLLDNKLFTDLRAWCFLAGLFGVLLIGLADDLYGMKPSQRLSLSLIAMAFPILGGHFVFNFFPSSLLPQPVIGFLNGALTFAWLLFFLHAYRSMDGLDGLAAGFARLSALSLFISFPCMVIRLNNQLIIFSFISMPILVSACTGFLYWNRPPAKVSMGNAGSLTLGYLFGMVVLYPGIFENVTHFLRNNEWKPLATLTFITILLPFIFDPALALIRRGPHLYQRLINTGLSSCQVASINRRRFWMINLAALGGALASHPAWRGAAFVFALVVMLQYWRLVLVRERSFVILTGRR